MDNLLHYFASGTCSFKAGSNFLAFPHWYQDLPGVLITNAAGASVCNPQFTSISDFWIVAATLIAILLRIAALAAVAYLIYGGVLYTTSQGSPEQTGKAKNTIISAFIGLALAIIATTVVTFIAGSIN